MLKEKEKSYTFYKLNVLKVLHTKLENKRHNLLKEVVQCFLHVSRHKVQLKKH